MKIAKILSVIGLTLILLSCITPFTSYLSEDVEDMLFFRVIITGSLCLSIASAVVFRKDFYLSNLLISLTGGILGLLIVSTARLFKEFDTEYYFLIPIYIVLFGMMFITLTRLCFSKVLRLFRSLSL